MVMQDKHTNRTDPASESGQSLPNSDQPSQLMDDKAEKYLRESGEIEDLPEDEDVDDYDEKVKEETKRRPL
jgi:hypothetical protein